MPVRAQLHDLPRHFGQFFYDAQINPAIGETSDKLELTLASRQNASVFSSIHTRFASGFYRLPSSSANFHALGLHINRAVEEEYLSRNRLALSFSRHLKVSERYRLSAGLALGLYQFSIKSNPISGGASERAFDPSAGLHLYSERCAVSLTMRQISGAELQPIEQLIVLAPRYDLFAQHRFILSEALQLSPKGFIAYSEHSDDALDSMSGGLTLLMSVSDYVEFGASKEYENGYYAFLGIHEIKLESSLNLATRAH